MPEVIHLLNSNKKLISYLYDDIAVLILFNDHGLGDCIMFMPIYNKLKQLYPKVIFNLKCAPGQEYFNLITTLKYDRIFYIKFPLYNMVCNAENQCKALICCIRLIGIPFTELLDFTYKPVRSTLSLYLPSKTICVAFQCNSGPWKSIPYLQSKTIWNSIKLFGYNPIELYFQHQQYNKRNSKYDFIDNTTRLLTPSPQLLFDYIYSCDGFIGLNTGTLCSAAAIKPLKTLYLYRVRHFTPNYKRYTPLQLLDCTGDINKQQLKVFLLSLK